MTDKEWEVLIAEIRLWMEDDEQSKFVVLLKTVGGGHKRIILTKVVIHE